MSENAMTEGAQAGLEEATATVADGRSRPGDTVDNPSITPPPDPQDELDRLLNEAAPQPATIDTLLDERFPTEPAPEVPTDENSDVWAALNESQAQLMSVANQLAFKEEQAALAKARDEIRQGLPIDEKTADAFLHGMARADATLNKALKERTENPAAWASAVSKMKTNLQDTFSTRMDPSATEDREAALASAKEPGKPVELTEKDISHMPSREFDELQKEHGVRPYGQSY